MFIWMDVWWGLKTKRVCVTHLWVGFWVFFCFCFVCFFGGGLETTALACALYYNVWRDHMLCDTWISSLYLKAGEPHSVHTYTTHSRVTRWLQREVNQLRAHAPMSQFCSDSGLRLMLHSSSSSTSPWLPTHATSLRRWPTPHGTEHCGAGLGVGAEGGSLFIVSLYAGGRTEACSLTGLHSDRTSHWLQIFSWHVDLVAGLSDDPHSSGATVTEVSVPPVPTWVTRRQMTWRCWVPGPHLLLHSDHSPRSQLSSNRQI